MDNEIRKSKRANERLTCGMRGHSHLTHLGPTGGMGREGEKGEKKKKKEKALERERLYLISKFPGNRTGGFRRSKEGKFILAARASHRDQNWGVLKNSER